MIRLYKAIEYLTVGPIVESPDKSNFTGYGSVPSHLNVHGDVCAIVQCVLLETEASTPSMFVEWGDSEDPSGWADAGTGMSLDHLRALTLEVVIHPFDTASDNEDCIAAIKPTKYFIDRLDLLDSEHSTTPAPSRRGPCVSSPFLNIGAMVDAISPPIMPSSPCLLPTDRLAGYTPDLIQTARTRSPSRTQKAPQG